MGGEGGGGDGERKRHHEAEGREVRDDLVPTHHAGAEPRDEQGDEREGRRLERVGQAHRDAEMNELAEDRPARPCPTDLEAAIERVESGVRPACTKEGPEDEDRSQRSTDATPPWQSPPAE